MVRLWWCDWIDDVVVVVVVERGYWRSEIGDEGVVWLEWDLIQE